MIRFISALCQAYLCFCGAVVLMFLVDGPTLHAHLVIPKPIQVAAVLAAVVGFFIRMVTL